MDDWREQGQESYLSKSCFKKSKYFIYREGWEHDHCEYCGIKFCLYDDCQKYGYFSENGYYWVCLKCWHDFNKKHKLKLCNDSDN